MQEAYLFLGKEEGDKYDFIKKLEKDLLKKFNDRVNIERFFCGESPLSSIFDSLVNGNFFFRL